MRPIIHKIGGCFGKVRAVDGKLKSHLEWAYSGVSRIWGRGVLIIQYARAKFKPRPLIA